MHLVSMLDCNKNEHAIKCDFTSYLLHKQNLMQLHIIVTT